MSSASTPFAKDQFSTGMKLTPLHGPGKNGPREYRTPDGLWRLIRTRTPAIRWEVQRRSDTAGWVRSATFAKRRDARLFLEDTLDGQDERTT